MKLSKQLSLTILIIFLIEITSWINVEHVYCGSLDENLKLIETIQKDTTGTGYNDEIRILADEKRQGYIIDIKQKNGKVFRLRPGRTQYDFLAPYTSFWKLNTLTADINNDRIPEIVTWGSMTHENDINIFQWDGKEYKVIFYGFYTDFYFKDITGDKILELVIENRIYGTGYEYIYFQWKKDHYEKIYYDLDAARGFDKIEYLLNILSDPNKDSYILEHPEYLLDSFTQVWVGSKKNLEYMKKLNSEILSMQLLEYIDDKAEQSKDNNSPARYNWKLKVLVFKMKGSAVVTEEKLLEVQTELANPDNNEYKINSFKLY